MPSTVTLHYKDASEETGLFTVDIPNITEANVAQWLNPSLPATDIGALHDAGKLISAAELFKVSVSMTPYVTNNPQPANWVSAHRELGLRLFYRDVVNGKRFYRTVPAPDTILYGLPTAGTDNYPINLVPAIAAMVTWMEAHSISPYGNAIEVTEAKLVPTRG